MMMMMNGGWDFLLLFVYMLRSYDHDLSLLSY